MGASAAQKIDHFGGIGLALHKIIVHIYKLRTALFHMMMFMILVVTFVVVVVVMLLMCFPFLI